MITIKKLNSVIVELRKIKDLDQLQLDQKVAFCENHDIKLSQFNIIVNNIISEGEKDVSELDMGGRFAQQDPHLQRVPSEFADFEKKYAEQQVKDSSSEVVFRTDDWGLVKNPKTLDGFGKYARGVIVENGDFYLSQSSSGVIHNRILNVLAEKNIIPSSLSHKWATLLPQQSKFLTVQRYRDTNIIAIGESNRLIYDIEEWKKYAHLYEEYLNMAKQKNPNLEFVNKLIGTLSIKFSSGEHIINHPDSE